MSRIGRLVLTLKPTNSAVITLPDGREGRIKLSDTEPADRVRIVLEFPSDVQIQRDEHDREKAPKR